MKHKELYHTFSKNQPLIFKKFYAIIYQIYSWAFILPSVLPRVFCVGVFLFYLLTATQNHDIIHMISFVHYAYSYDDEKSAPLCRPQNVHLRVGCFFHA